MTYTVSNLEQLLASQEITFGKHSSELAKTLVKIGQSALANSNYPKAESSYWRALEILQKTHGDRHVEVLVCIEQLAEICQVQSNELQADRLREQAALIREKLPPSKLPPPKPPALKPVQTAQSAVPASPAPHVPFAALVPSAAPAPATARDRCPHGYNPVLCSVCRAKATTPQQQEPEITRIAFRQESLPVSAKASISGLTVKSSGKRIPLKGDIFWIGRDRINDISLPDDAAVARSHAVIELAKDHYWIRKCTANDLVMLNGLPVVDKTKLSPGDVIKVGGSEIQAD